MSSGTFWRCSLGTQSLSNSNGGISVPLKGSQPPPPSPVSTSEMSFIVDYFQGSDATALVEQWWRDTVHSFRNQTSEKQPLTLLEWQIIGGDDAVVNRVSGDIVDHMMMSGVDMESIAAAAEPINETSNTTHS